MDASTTHENAHSSLPPSSPALLPDDDDDEHRVGLAPIGLDTVSCVYSSTTQTVSQLALRPDPRNLASSALRDRFSEVQDDVADLVATVLHASESGATLPSRFSLHSASHGFSLDCVRQPSGPVSRHWQWLREGRTISWSEVKWKVVFRCEAR